MKKCVLYILALFTLFSVSAQERNIIEEPATGIDSAFCYFDSNGKAHLRADLSTKEVQAIEAAAIRVTEEFNKGVAQLWKPWTQKDREDYSQKELDNYKDNIEKNILKLFISNAEVYYSHESSMYKVYKYNGEYYYRDRNGVPQRAYNPQRDGNGVLRETVEEDVRHRPATIEITSKYKKSSPPKEVRKYLGNVKNSNNYVKVEFNCGGFTVSNKLKKDKNGSYVGTISYYQDFTGTTKDGYSYSDRTYRTVTIYVEVTVQPGPGGDMVVWNIKLGDIRATATVSQ